MLHFGENEPKRGLCPVVLFEHTADLDYSSWVHSRESFGTERCYLGTAVHTVECMSVVPLTLVFVLPW